MQIDSQNMSVGEIHLRHIPIYSSFVGGVGQTDMDGKIGLIYLRKPH